MTLQPDILDGLAALATAGLGWLGWKLKTLINTNIKDANARRALLLIDDAVITAAKAVQQTLVGRMKIASKSGKLTVLALKEVRQAAYDAAISTIGESGRALAAEALGYGAAELRKVVETKLEAAVHDIKN